MERTWSQGCQLNVAENIPETDMWASLQTVPPLVLIFPPISAGLLSQGKNLGVTIFVGSFSIPSFQMATKCCGYYYFILKIIVGASYKRLSE